MALLQYVMYVSSAWVLTSVARLLSFFSLLISISSTDNSAVGHSLCLFLLYVTYYSLMRNQMIKLFYCNKTRASGWRRTRKAYSLWPQWKIGSWLGLLNTPPGSPICGFKNQRAYPNCHAVIKYMSKFEGRDMFVRDVNHLHHF